MARLRSEPKTRRWRRTRDRSSLQCPPTHPWPFTQHPTPPGTILGASVYEEAVRRAEAQRKGGQELRIEQKLHGLQRSPRAGVSGCRMAEW